MNGSVSMKEFELLKSRVKDVEDKWKSVQELVTHQAEIIRKQKDFIEKQEKMFNAFMRDLNNDVYALPEMEEKDAETLKNSEVARISLNDDSTRQANSTLG